MFNRLKESVKNFSKINPISLLGRFRQEQSIHRKDYVDYLTSDEELQTIADEKRLEAMVSEQIRADFPEVSDSSFELLVDATMHHIRKKQLQAMDDICFK